MQRADLAIRFEGVSRSFDREAGDALVALRDVSAEVGVGRTVAVVGRSGSGKSTLLHLAAAIDRPTAGRVLVMGRDTAAMSERERNELRRREVGLVFQFFHLLPHLTVRENVIVPAWIAGERDRSVAARVDELLRRVGLDGRADDPVDVLSGGEMQRVAICRALLHRPRLLLADEPTGSLDDETGRRVMDLFLELVRDSGATLLFVTHSVEVAARADDVWTLHSGVLEAS